MLTKKPISPSISARERLATGMPTGSSAAPVSPVEQRGEGGEEGHEEGGVPRAGQPAQASARPGGELPGAAAAAAGGGRRARAVGGQLQGGEAGELPPPVAELLRQHLAAQPLPLPDRVVGVLHRQLGQRRRRPRDEGGVEPGQLGDEHLAQRPAVGGDVVGAPERDVLLVRQPQEEGAQQGPALEVERPAASSPAIRRASPPRAASGRAERSTTGRGSGAQGWISCTAPVGGWRGRSCAAPRGGAGSRERAAARAAASSRPASRTAARML